ncbi:uncharacterized protein LOC133720905 [Rosa rugosa]|uniref:uncharacterized protein LOC133720905 n=1 Tax=Rosa rugosa TaxID=74645 RepID=UPI002B414822|nr:uncharacterized protein LOC133720905 [Rosa rugosa]
MKACLPVPSSILRTKKRDESSTVSTEVVGVWILWSDLALVLARHYPELTHPDLVGLEPLAAIVPAGCRPRRGFVHGDLAHQQQLQNPRRCCHPSPSSLCLRPMRLNSSRAGRIMHIGNVKKATGMPVSSNFQTMEYLIVLMALCNKKECHVRMSC